jgi:hypothetical protein
MSTHCCGQNILHVTQMGCKTINFDRFRGNTANKGFCRVRIDLQNAVVILVLRFATLQNKLATAVTQIWCFDQSRTGKNTLQLLYWVALKRSCHAEYSSVAVTGSHSNDPVMPDILALPGGYPRESGMSKFAQFITVLPCLAGRVWGVYFGMIL